MITRGDLKFNPKPLLCPLCGFERHLVMLWPIMHIKVLRRGVKDKCPRCKDLPEDNYDCEWYEI